MIFKQIVSFNVIRRSVGTKDIQLLLKKSANSFEQILQKVKIIKASSGTCIAEMKVEMEHTNLHQKLHGGTSATLVDTISTYALLTHSKCEMLPTVSVDLYLTYMKGANLGEVIEIHSQTISVGKTLAFAEVVIKNKESGAVLLKGSHTKFVLRPRKRV